MSATKHIVQLLITKTSIYRTHVVPKQTKTIPRRSISSSNTELTHQIDTVSYSNFKNYGFLSEIGA